LRRSGIQVVLIGGVAIIFLYYIFRLRNAFIDLLALLIFSGLAIYFILFPDYTTTIARKLGVGRGADLLFYICILFFLFVVMKLFNRIRRLENTITELVRKNANDNAVYLDDENEREK
jgi:small membrane protein